MIELEEKDSLYFRKAVNEQSDHLQALCSKWELELANKDLNIPEDGKQTCLSLPSILV